MVYGLFASIRVVLRACQPVVIGIAGTNFLLFPVSWRAKRQHELPVVGVDNSQRGHRQRAPGRKIDPGLAHEVRAE